MYEMMQNTTIHIFALVVFQRAMYLVNLLLIIISMSLSSIWLIICMKLCHRVALSYRASKRTPLLHPIHKGVQYLSLQRNLYNLRTHFIKYILICMCLCVEMLQVVSIFTYIILNEKHKYTFSRISSNNLSCFFNPYFSNIYRSPILIPILNSYCINSLLLSTLLSILTRYLAARYLNHSFKRTLTKYLLWLVIQFIIVILSSTLYTFILSFILFPLLLIINWLVLFRDSRILSRVLRSNLIELEFHSGNKVLYREQLIAYKSYRIFIKTLIFSQCFLVAFSILFLLVKFFLLIFHDSCILYYIYGITLQFRVLKNSIEPIKLSADIVLSLIMLFSSISNILPLICVSLFPLIKKYRSRNNVYRYNYDNITQPLLK